MSLQVRQIYLFFNSQLSLIITQVPPLICNHHLSNPIICWNISVMILMLRQNHGFTTIIIKKTNKLGVIMMSNYCSNHKNLYNLDIHTQARTVRESWARTWLLRIP